MGYNTTLLDIAKNSGCVAQISARFNLLLQHIMSPIFEGSIAFAFSVAFRALLLGKVAFAVGNHTSHVVDL